MPMMNTVIPKTNTEVTPATARCRCHNSTRSPAKNRASADWSNTGIAFTMDPTCHRSRLFRRYWRNFEMCSESTDRPLLNSLSHCLTRMPTEAEERLRTRLVNQHMLSDTAHRGIAVEVIKVAPDDRKAGCVELMNGWTNDRLPSWSEMCWRIADDWSGPGSGWSSLYDSTLNAVRIAENKPAYAPLKSTPKSHILRHDTHIDEIRINFLAPSLNKLVAILLHSIGYVRESRFLLFVCELFST